MRTMLFKCSPDPCRLPSFFIAVSVDMTATIVNKTSTRLPESLWIQCVRLGPPTSRAHGCGLSLVSQAAWLALLLISGLSPSDSAPRWTQVARAGPCTSSLPLTPSTLSSTALACVAAAPCWTRPLGAPQCPSSFFVSPFLCLFVHSFHFSFLPSFLPSLLP